MPDFSLERAHGSDNGALVIGVDEVGRGPLAGPVMAGAVLLPPAVLALPQLAGIDDSKRLTASRRQALAAAIHAHAAVGLGEASVAEIEALNVLGAAMLAMRRAVAALADRIGAVPAVALVDGNRDPGLPCPAVTVVGGDRRSLSIAAASIVAKVRRDALMAALDRVHPGYGWARNAGYGTAEHLAALGRLGPSVHHRAGFAPVRTVLASRESG